MSFLSSIDHRSLFSSRTWSYLAPCSCYQAHLFAISGHICSTAPAVSSVWSRGRCEYQDFLSMAGKVYSSSGHVPLHLTAWLCWFWFCDPPHKSKSSFPCSSEIAKSKKKKKVERFSHFFSILYSLGLSTLLCWRLHLKYRIIQSFLPIENASRMLLRENKFLLGKNRYRT